MINIQWSAQILFIFLSEFRCFDRFYVCWLCGFSFLFLLKLLLFAFILVVFELILFLFFLLFVKRRSDNIFPRLFETFFNDLFILIELFIHLFGFHFLFNVFRVFIIILRLISKFGKIDLDFGGSKISVMIIFSDLLCSLWIFESNESEFSRLAFLIFGNFTISEWLSIVFEMFFDLFLSEVFGDIFDNDSTHKIGEMTILFYYNINLINNYCYNSLFI